MGADQAFAVLVRASQDTNTKLVDVVPVLTTTGDLTGAGSDGERLRQGSSRRRP
ncbi:ANTAR domain-containing protein [Jidongwangia harbinensis]|uniref:ANTAR domain-containing protein n=1 Tax=Jidongwangia harbinensis TaxID=2878561 RepID=UPI0035578F81